MMEPKMKGRRYNWLEWFSKSKIKLYKNIDYNGLDSSFAHYARRAAKRYGYIISITIGEGELTIEVCDKIEQCPEVHTNKYRKDK